MLQRYLLKRLALILTLSLGLSFYSYSQWSFTAGLGGTVYVGDVGTSVLNRPAINADIWYQFNKNFSYRLSSGFAWLKGTDESSFAIERDGPVLNRKRDFETLTYEFFGEFVYHKNFNRVTPYIGIGAGILFMGVTSRNYTPGKSFSNIHSFGSRSPEGRDIPNWTQIISTSLGVKYALTGKFSLLLEYSGKLTMTDILDGVSARQVSNNASDIWFDEGRLGGNPDSNDAYGVLSLKVMYTPKQYLKNSQYMDFRRTQETKRFKRRKTWKRW